ncbi:hypothetical protein DFH07DRAFT_517285 [Mycena maculata]|uniref:DUF6534 domain-containing protein n=1 Tax=Mycena maculata TaxID=230809 RepID=A0AAD7IZ22_9AGAR|nr:hypothetical protein DFH07DRAFT_517285 [Mycena maculata]
MLVNNSDSVRIADDPKDYSFPIPGAILMDGLLHSFCLGFVLALGMKYWEDRVEDSIRKRIFVLAVVFLSIAQTILEDYKTWSVAVSQHPWASSPWLWAEFFINGAISAMCEGFYIRRCWKMTGRSRWVLYPMALLWTSLVGAQFYITITLGLEFQHYLADGHRIDGQVQRLFHHTILVFPYWVVGCAILDIVVAIILVTCLLRSKTGLHSSDWVVYRIVFLALETALLPSISMVIGVVILHESPHPGQRDDLVCFFVFITAKLYAIGLLRTLNARTRLRERLDSTDLGRTTLSTWSWAQEQHKASTPNPDRTSKLTMETATTLPGSVESAQGPCEGIAPMDIPAPESPRVHFGSPILDQYERGYARLRVSSINRTNQEIDEQP